MTIAQIKGYLDEQFEQPVELQEEGGFNLSKRDLRGINLSGLDLQYSNFYHSNLVGAILNGCLLDHTGWKGANLTKTQFEDASVTYGRFQEAIIQDTNFDGANLDCADFEEAQLKSLTYDLASLNGCNLLEQMQIQGLLVVTTSKLERIDLSLNVHQMEKSSSITVESLSNSNLTSDSSSPSNDVKALTETVGKLLAVVQQQQIALYQAPPSIPTPAPSKPPTNVSNKPPVTFPGVTPEKTYKKKQAGSFSFVKNLDNVTNRKYDYNFLTVEGNIAGEPKVVERKTGWQVSFPIAIDLLIGNDQTGFIYVNFLVEHEEEARQYLRGQRWRIEGHLNQYESKVEESGKPAKRLGVEVENIKRIERPFERKIPASPSSNKPDEPEPPYVRNDSDYDDFPF